MRNSMSRNVIGPGSWAACFLRNAVNADSLLPTVR